MRVLKPEYVFRPSQIVQRLRYAAGSTKRATSATTPWGLTIQFDPEELHGRAMLTLGLTDLRTNEVISRILGPGDFAVDVGANIGIMASLMACRVGPSGHVFCFEPHPVTRRLLEKNVEIWNEESDTIAPTEVLPYGASSENASLRLYEPTGFGDNSGVATFNISDAEQATDRFHEVKTARLDDWFSDVTKISLVKIDVEGYEDQVLSGMQMLLSDKRVDYMIFEEHRSLPSSATEFLDGYGYKSFQIDRTFWKLTLTDVNASPPRLRGEPTNILAVRDVALVQGLETGGGNV